MDLKRIYRWEMVLVSLFGVYITAKHLVNAQPFLALLGPTSLLFLLIPPAAERLFRMRLGYPLKLWVLTFSYMGFSLGTALRWFDRFGPYDNINHFLSGILFTMIGFCLFARVREEKPVDRSRELLLQISYAFCFSMFVAVIWEIFEYTGFQLTGHDSQHTLTTGVNDTMEDIIACFLGSAVMALAYARSYGKGRYSWLCAPIRAFDRANHPDGQ
ncbi:hypothetical protein LJC63_04350 [Ruminococcaceae bacterium OttesenSCG-928-L11]|nr:hypothetical protein [Ruminococcaceae bacterium OttesenSCG-928-L11]